MTMTGGSFHVDNALNPAWREAVLHFIHTRSWKDDVPQSVVDSAYHNATYVVGGKLQQLAPTTSAYINEVRLGVKIFPPCLNIELQVPSPWSI